MVKEKIRIIVCSDLLINDKDLIVVNDLNDFLFLREKCLVIYNIGKSYYLIANEWMIQYNAKGNEVISAINEINMKKRKKRKSGYNRYNGQQSHM